MNEEEICRKLQYLQQKFGLPAISITDQVGIHRAVDIIAEHFTEEEKKVCKTEQT
jgi:hypothetical protein